MRSGSSVVRRAGGLALALCLALGCAGTPEEEAGGAEPQGLAAAPVWILQGCRAYWGDDAGHHLCGVGSASGPAANASLVRSTAVGRGRTQVARILHDRLQSALAEVVPADVASTAAGSGSGDAAGGARDAVDLSKRITDASLPGATPVQTWISPYGTCYALVALDIGTFTETVRGMESLPEEVRRAVLERVDRIFAAPDASEAPDLPAAPHAPQAPDAGGAEAPATGGG